MLILHLSGVEVFCRTAFIVVSFVLALRRHGVVEEVCVLVYTTNSVLNCVVVCLLTGISLDRWVNVTNPLKGRIISRLWRIKGPVLIWVYSILTSILTIPFSVYRKSMDKIPSNDTGNHFTNCGGKQTIEAKVLVITNFVSRSVIPLIIICISYIKILSVLRRRSKSKLKTNFAKKNMVS